MEEFDVCIVGGSIAGNYLCYLLSKFNFKVAVVEEHEEIGLPFECAGIISQKLGELIDLPKQIVLNRVETAKIVAPRGISIKLSGEERPYIIDRVALDKLFYDKVKDLENVRYFLKEKFRTFSKVKESGGNSVIIVTSKRKIKSRLLVGCDGPLSSVGRQLGVKNDIIYGTQIRIKAQFPTNEALMWFDPRWKELFGWIVPEGKNGIYRIGMGARNNIASNFKVFLDNLGVSADERIDRQGGIIPLGTMNHVAFDNVMLLGDSAGQVKATTGGGIVMLLTAAKYAAHAVKKCFNANNFSKAFIEHHYEYPCRKTLNRQLKIHLIISKVFEHFTNEDYETFFQIVKSSKIESVISLYGDMDFPKSLFIKLLRNSLVLKFLLRFIKKNPLILIELIKILRK